MTATQLAYGALRLCREGLARVGRTGSTEQYADALNRLNDMIDAWGAERITIYVLLRTLQTLASGTASYTIGTGGTIAIVRPATIDHAALIIDLNADPETEDPIDVYTDQEWEGIQQKELTSPYIQGIYFDHGWSAGLATITVWPIPTIATTRLVLYTPQALTAFADLTTNYTFPNGYAEALRYQLALRLAPEFGGLVDPQDTIDRAKKSFALIKRANIRPRQSILDSRTPGIAERSIYDWRTDTFR